MHALSSEVIRACIPSGQVKPFPGNCMSLMTVSGAKGSLVNFSQVGVQGSRTTYFHEYTLP